ncbi:hypothetical protein BJ165DRAFT_1399876 [Panaeolus papilionaceus]|nr:hypothetical protein BJ165DRAFT_1399876 [Panaeolus papilionaceus]
MFEADHDDDALPQPGAPPSTSEIVSFLHHTSPSKLTLKPWNLTSSEIQAIFHAASAVTSLTIDQSLITHLDPSFRGVFQNALLTSRDRYTLREASAHVLYPLLTQERWSIIGGIPERAYILKKPLLSELVSFTIIEDIESQLPILPSSVEVLVSFLKGRIHGELIDHDTMSLRNVNLVLRERPNDTVDLMADMARHMESVGRNIGRDITLNVSYRKSSEIYAHVDVDALQPDNEQDVIFIKVEDKSTWDYHMQF